MTDAVVRTSLDGFHTTATAQRGDELARTFVTAINRQDTTTLDRVLGSQFPVLRSRRAPQPYRTQALLRRPARRVQRPDPRSARERRRLGGGRSDCAADLIMTGIHTGNYLGVAATNQPIQTSISHVLRTRDDQITEHWPVMDTYRILVRDRSHPRRRRRLPTTPRCTSGRGRHLSRTAGHSLRYTTDRPHHLRAKESRAVSLRASSTEPSPPGSPPTSTRWPKPICRTADGRLTAGTCSGTRGRSAAARCPTASLSRPMLSPKTTESATSALWDGTITQSGSVVDFTSADFFRINYGLAAEHWDTVDYVRLYQSFGLLPVGQF